MRRVRARSGAMVTLSREKNSVASTVPLSKNASSRSTSTTRSASCFSNASATASTVP